MEMTIKSVGNLNQFEEVVSRVPPAAIHLAANKVGVILEVSAPPFELAEQLRRVAYKRGQREGKNSHFKKGFFFLWLGRIAEEIIAVLINSTRQEVSVFISEEMEYMRYGEDGEQISFEPYDYEQPWYAVGTLDSLIGGGVCKRHLK